MGIHMDVTYKHAALIVTLLFACTLGNAADEPSDSKSTDLFPEEWFISTHQVVSKRVGAWSNGLDSFFSGRRDQVANQSFVSMRFGSLVEEAEGISGFFNLDTRIRLPNTEDRLSLVIETDGDELTQDNQVNENVAGQNIIESARTTRISTALRYIKKEWNTNVDAGVLLDMPMDPFVRIKVKQTLQKDSWSFTQSESLFSYYSQGNGGRYSVSANRKINDKFGFNADLGITHLDSESETYWRENIYINHALSSKSKLRYQLSYLQSGWPKPTSDSVLYFLQYQRLLYDNWLVGEIKPQVSHERDNDYEASTSLTLSLEVLLGQEYL